jgi:small basic protein
MNSKEGVMVYIAILLGCIIGAIVGMNAPIISYTYSNYLAIAIIAALDSVFGGVTSIIKKNFDLKIFLTGFFGNAVLSILLTMLGEKINVDIYLAAIIVFVGRMFTNLAIIRRYYIEKISKTIENVKDKKKQKEEVISNEKIETEEKVVEENTKKDE